MQFPVPQFTDVEDKIIANLTFRQFGIILATGALIFVTYSLSKDFIVTGISAIFIGIPGLILAFAPFNGRPMYRNIPLFLKYLTSDKVMVFRKQSTLAVSVSVANLDIQTQAKSKTSLDEDPRSRLKKIEYQLEQRAKEEEDILEKQ